MLIYFMQLFIFIGAEYLFFVWVDKYIVDGYMNLSGLWSLCPGVVALFIILFVLAGIEAEIEDRKNDQNR